MAILIEKTIGKLRQYTVPENDLSKYPFAVTYKHLNSWEDFGSWNENERTIYQNGISKEINIDNYLFDNKIRSKEHYVKSRDTSTFYFTINGMTPTGKVFEIKFKTWGNEEILIYMIYAMVLISCVGPEKAKDIWVNFRGEYWPQKSIDEQLRDILDIKSIALNIIEKHPYMTLFFQDSIQKLIKFTKQSLENLEL